MILRRSLYLIGTGCIIGVVISAAILYRRKANESESCSCSKASLEDRFTLTNLPTNNSESDWDSTLYEDNKNSAAENAYFRHKAAASIMKDSVEAIRENVKISEGTNNDLDQISEELDKLLSDD